MRFYHDPLTDRLEPILFDNMGNVPRRSREPVVVHPGNTLLEEFARCRPYYDGVFEHLGRITAPAWLDQLFADLDEDWTRFEAALVADGPLPQRMTKAGMQQRLRTQRAHLRTLVLPDDPANFVAYV